ncbi:hypothetical protein [Sphingobium sp. BS19]|uniref:hypothetical protein n=1 Tax=Sphingobium sp. BS19 TaxID=3018973 RepID=UPI0024901B92|nr:hypothetical protein [Sphingobium sp. BS19]
MGKLFNFRSRAAAAAILFALSTQTSAQNDPTAGTIADTAKINAEAERLKAEAGKINAQADLERAKVSALGLPSYAGTTKLNAGAGDMEAMLLTAPAVRVSGAKIAEAVPTGDHVLLLTRDDTFDFGLVGSITAEIDGLARQFEAFGIDSGGPLRGQSVKLVPGAVAVISAIAGMARSETEATAANVSVSDSMLLTAVAAKLKNRARLPGSAIGTVEVASDGTNSPLLARLGNLGTSIYLSPCGRWYDSLFLRIGSVACGKQDFSAYRNI